MTRPGWRTAVLACAAVAALCVSPRAQGSGEVALRAAIETETVKGDLKGAIEQYRQIARSGDRGLAAKALICMADCY